MFIEIHSGPNGQCNEYDYAFSLQMQHLSVHVTCIQHS